MPANGLHTTRKSFYIERDILVNQESFLYTKIRDKHVVDVSVLDNETCRTQPTQWLTDIIIKYNTRNHQQTALPL